MTAGMFDQIKNPFGGVDEQAMQNQFFAMCGGVVVADRLMHLWNCSYPGISSNIFDKPSKMDAFKHKAKREGFTDKQITAFLQLQ